MKRVKREGIGQLRFVMKRGRDAPARRPYQRHVLSPLPAHLYLLKQRYISLPFRSVFLVCHSSNALPLR